MPKPGMPRALGLVQSLGALFDSEAFFRRRSRGPAPFGMQIPGLGEVLFASRAEHVREFLTIPPATLTPPLPNPIEPVVGTGSIILLDGDRHRAERARFLPALQGERIRRYAPAMAEVTRDEVDAWAPGDLVDVRDAAQTITLQIIIRAVFGVTDKDRAREFVRVVKSMMGAYTAPFMFFPVLRRAPGGLGPWRGFTRRRRELDDLLSEQIAARRAEGTDGHDDVLSVLLEDGTDGPRTDDQVRQQLRTLMVSGHETSATTLAWALYHIHRDDLVRKRLMDELGGDGDVERLPKLPYLNAVISETLRLHPTVSIVVRQLKHPITAWKRPRGHGDVVGVALPALHSDPAVWPDPRHFSPERFLDRKPTPFEYSPFGYGHRRCPGAAFANLELAVILGTILTTVDLRMPETERRRRPPRSIPRGVAALPNRPISLRVARRL